MKIRTNVFGVALWALLCVGARDCGIVGWDKYMPPGQPSSPQGCDSLWWACGVEYTLSCACGDSDGATNDYACAATSSDAASVVLARWPKSPPLVGTGFSDPWVQAPPGCWTVATPEAIGPPSAADICTDLCGAVPTCGSGLAGDPCSGAADCASCLCEPSAEGFLCL